MKKQDPIDGKKVGSNASTKSKSKPVPMGRDLAEILDDFEGPDYGLDEIPGVCSGLSDALASSRNRLFD